MLYFITSVSSWSHFIINNLYFAAPAVMILLSTIHKWSMFPMWSEGGFHLKTKHDLFNWCISHETLKLVSCLFSCLLVLQIKSLLRCSKDLLILPGKKYPMTNVKIHAGMKLETNYLSNQQFQNWYLGKVGKAWHNHVIRLTDQIQGKLLEIQS